MFCYDYCNLYHKFPCVMSNKISESESESTTHTISHCVHVELC